MKQILFTIHSLELGGAEKVLCDILDSFDYSKYHVDLLLYNNIGPLLSNLNKNVSLYYVYKEEVSIFERLIRKLFKMAGKLDWYERRIVVSKIQPKYAAIISFCQGPGHKLHTLILDKSDNNISWVHSDLSVSNWGLKFFHDNLKEQESAYNAMNKIVFVSKEAKTTFNRVFNIDEDVEQHIVYNFVNKENVLLKSQEPISVKKTKYTFINIGRMVEAKRQDRLIEASKLLKDKGYDFEMWILGDGPLRTSLERKSIESGTSDVVIFQGMQTNPYAFLRKSDCFVFSSQQEGFGLVIGESFVLSKPVISTNVTGPAEILEDGKYGIVVEQDVQQIAVAMEQMMIDNATYSYYSKKGYERLEYFAPEKIMDQIYQICQK